MSYSYFTAVVGDRSAEGNSVSCKKTMLKFEPKVQNFSLSVPMIKAIPKKTVQGGGLEFPVLG